jgi:ABC-type uncharacterized transport system permease subunit
MSLIRIERNPSPRQLAVFAVAWAVFLGLWACACWIRGRHTAAGILWVAAAAAPVAGAASRRLLRLIFVGLSYATYPLGFVVSHVVLALVYFLALTPIGLTMRLLGRDPLSRKFDPKAPSYWKPRQATKPVESYFNQN